MAQDRFEAGGRFGSDPESEHVRMFRDRQAAGRHLARLLQHTRALNPIVLALPRGGVPVAYEIARDLGAPLDVFLVRKIGAPGHRELGIGAVAQGGVRILNEAAIAMLDVPREEIARITAEETAELERRLRQYRGDRPLPDLNSRTVILVDDGLATGVSAMAAIRALRRLHPSRLILAVPVCAPETAEALRPDVDDVVCVLMPRNFVAVGFWYRTFDQTSDAEVLDLLDRARRPRAPAAEGSSETAGPLPSEANPV
ncbi:MAG: phosphoribosyltransferase [Dehalococcoidia bacterium]